MTTEPRNGKDPTYLVGRSEAETPRLISRSGLYGRFTRRLLEDAGVEKGMKVLDIGTGAGDLALMAAEMVGPTGGSSWGWTRTRRSSRPPPRGPKRPASTTSTPTWTTFARMSPATACSTP